jgi:hypothetical protein
MRILIVTGIVFLQIGFVYFTLWGIASNLRRWVGEIEAIAGAICVFAVASLLIFWLSWSIPQYQAIFRVGVSLCLLFWATTALLHGSERISLVLPFAIAAIVSTGLFLIVHGADHSGASPMRVAAKIFTHELPGDNEIPMVFADAILKGHVPSPFYGDWLSSDRPPLQTGMYLLSPVVSIVGNKGLGYQALAIAVQMFVLIGVWCLARAMNSTRAAAALAMIAVTFTPIAIVNGVFVWPKLLAAGFVAVAFALHFYGKRTTVIDGTVVGTSCAMALLSHGSAIFTLLGMFIAALLMRRLGNLKYIASAVLCVVVLYSPWLAYQQFVDPPGDRLVKWHFAGVGIEGVDNRPLSTALKDAYADVTLTGWVHGREQAFWRSFMGLKDSYAGTLSAAQSLFIQQDGQASAKLATVRSQQFYGVVIAGGLLGLAFMLIPLGLLDNSLRPLCLVIALNFIIWWAVLYDPLGAIVHQGSYFPEIAIVAGFVVFLARRWPRIAVSAVGAQVALTAFQFSM